MLRASRGVDLALNYRDKRARAETVAQVEASGRRALLVQADVTAPDEVARMFRETEAAFGGLELLFLNASGGLEKHKAADYAMRLNRDAQLELLTQILPLMPEGSRVVFVTSHLAHFYDQTPGIPGYEAVAEGKRAGEDALRALMPELDARGVSLVVVSGNFIEGTITPKLLRRTNPGLTEARREQTGGLPTTEEFATATADAAGDSGLESGSTVFVGSVT